MGGSSKSTVTNNISNLTVNKSNIEALNSSTNEFVTNNLMTDAAACSASSVQTSENEIGDITVIGKKSKVSSTFDSNQDTKVSLECIQQSITQMDISSAMANSILQNMEQSISNDAMTKLVSSAEASMKAGAGGGVLNPFSSSNSSINMNLSNTQINDTSRKLSNYISNKVATTVKSDSIKECFAKSVQMQKNTVGNVKLIGEDNEANFNFSTNQIGKSLATCQQLTQQTSSVVNQMATDFGLKIVDDTKNKVSTEATSKAKAETSVAGFDAIIDSIFGGLKGIVGLYVAAIAAVCCCCLSVCAMIFIVPRLGKKSESKTEDESNNSKDENPNKSDESDESNNSKDENPNKSDESDKSKNTPNTKKKLDDD
jgi:hypothetical protein